MLSEFKSTGWEVEMADLDSSPHNMIAMAKIEKEPFMNKQDDGQKDFVFFQVDVKWCLN